MQIWGLTKGAEANRRDLNNPRRNEYHNDPKLLDLFIAKTCSFGYNMHTCHISNCEIKSHRIWPIWKPLPIRFFNFHRIFRPSYNTFYGEINIHHTLLCLSEASYIKLRLLTILGALQSNFYKQVAQRATFTHLSPMCQGQISFQKTYKWGHGNQRPKIELVWAFMPVLVTSNFDDDSIKNEWASMETPFSQYKSMGNVLDARGQLTP